MPNEIREFKKLVEDQYPEKKGYAEAVKYYFKIIYSNRAVKNSEKYTPVLMKFKTALKDFVDHESTTALVSRRSHPNARNKRLPEGRRF